MEKKELTREQKTARNRQNKKARQNYEKAHYNVVSFRLRKDGADGFTLEQMKHAAAINGYSLNAFILDALRDKV